MGVWRARKLQRSVLLLQPHRLAVHQWRRLVIPATPACQAASCPIPEIKTVSPPSVASAKIARRAYSAGTRFAHSIPATVPISAAPAAAITTSGSQCETPSDATVPTPTMKKTTCSVPRVVVASHPELTA